jgi:hypothetical protein
MEGATGVVGIGGGCVRREDDNRFGRRLSTPGVIFSHLFSWGEEIGEGTGRGAAKVQDV